MSEKITNENESVENTEEQVEETTEESTQEEESTEEQDVDYDGQLETRQEEREHNQKGYKQRKQKEVSEDDDESETPEEMMRRVIREERTADVSSNAHDVLQEELSKIDNPSERRLVEDYYNNTIKQSGTSRTSIIRDISLAKTLANQPKVQRENSEMKTAMKNRTGISAGDGSESNQDKPKSTVSKWSKEQLADFKKRGITAEEVEATQAKQASQQ